MRRLATHNEKAQARVIPAMVILLLFSASVLALSESFKDSETISSSKQIEVTAATKIKINKMDNGSLSLQLVLDNGTVLKDKEITVYSNGSAFYSDKTDEKGSVVTPLLGSGFHMLNILFPGESYSYLNPSSILQNISFESSNPSNWQGSGVSSLFSLNTKESYLVNETVFVRGSVHLNFSGRVVLAFYHNESLEEVVVNIENGSYSHSLKPPLKEGSWTVIASFMNMSRRTQFTVLPVNSTSPCELIVEPGIAVHEKIVLGEPVRWEQEINVKNPCPETKNFSIESPENTFNTSIMENDSSTIKPNETKEITLTFYSSPVNLEIKQTEKNIGEVIPTGAFNISVKENGSVEHYYNSTIGNLSFLEKEILVSQDSGLQYQNVSVKIPFHGTKYQFFLVADGKLSEESTLFHDGFVEWIIPNLTSEKALLREGIEKNQGKINFGEPVQWELKLSNKTINFLTFPVNKEVFWSNGYKRVVLSSEARVRYENISFQEDLPEIDYRALVYSLKNESREAFPMEKSDKVSFSDSNNDSSYDKIVFSVSLENQKTLDIDIDQIELIQSKLDNSTWNINFSTEGIADIVLSGLNGSELNEELEINSLTCGNISFEFSNNSLQDYSCSKNSSLKINHSNHGPYGIEIQFGQDYMFVSEDTNNTVKILDKREEKVDVLPGQTFCVERTIQGPTGEKANFVPMYSEGLELVSSELVKKETGPQEVDTPTQSILKQEHENIRKKVKELKNKVFDAGKPRLKEELEIESLREKLPEKLRELKHIAYSDDLEFNSNITIKYCFKAPSWEEIKSGKPSSGRISYLTYLGEDYDYETTTWWNASWPYRKQLNVTVGANTPYKGYDGYTVQIEVNTESMVSNGILMSNGSDLRIAYYNGSSMIELDRINASDFNTSNTEIRFQLQSNITANSTDSNYYLYYGNPSAGNPPENASNVYIWYDDASTNRLSQYQEGRIDSTCLGGLWGDSFSNGSGNYSFNTGDNNCDSIKPTNITERDIYFEFEEYQTGAHPTNMDSGVVVRWINSGAGAGLSEDSSHFYYYGLADSTFRGGPYGEHDDVRAAQRSNVIITQGALGEFPATTWTRMGIAVWDVNPTNIKTYFNNESGGWGGYYFNGTHAAGSDHESAGLFGPWLQQDIGSVRNLLARRYTEPEPNVTIVKTEQILKLTPIIDEPVQDSVKNRNVPFTLNGTLNCTGNSSINGCTDSKGWAQYYSVFSPTVSWSETTESDFTSSTESVNISISHSLNLESNNTPSWWDENWGYRKRVNVTNENYTRTLETGRAIVYSLNHSDLVSSGKSLANGNDLRLLYWNSTGSTWNELDRDISLLNSSSTQLWFSVQVNISANSSDSNYFLYYGNPDASSPPSDSSEIYGSGAVFVAHYDNSSTGVDGETPSTESGTTYNTGQFGTGINVSNGDNLRYSTNEVVYVPEGTMEFWFKPDWNASDNSGHEFFHMHESGGQEKYFILNKDDNSPGWGTSNYLKFMLEDSSDADIRAEYNQNFVEGNWYHIAASWEFPGTNNGDIFIYVNGQQVATASGLDNPISPDDNVAIGDYLNSYGTSQGEADGIIDEFRIWNSIKSTSEFNYFNPQPNITSLSEEALTVKPDGYYISDVFDPGSSDVQYENISWLAETNANATVSVYSRTSTGALADWWDQDWQYKKDINISNTAGELSNYQIKVNLNTTELNSTGKMRSDCGDIRFVQYSGSYSVLDYWIETDCNVSGGNTSFWVEVSSIENNTNTTISVYYGNSGASSVSNGTSTFEFFDDFEGTSIDSSIWDASSATDSVANSSLRINAGGVGLQNPLGFNFSDGYLAETKVLFHSLENAYGINLPELSSSQFTSSGNDNSDATVLYMRTGNSRTVYRWIGDGSTDDYNEGSGTTGWTSSDDTWYVTGVSVDGGIVRLWRDDSNIFTDSGITWSKEMDYLSLGYFDGSGSAMQDGSYDWVRVRKYVENGPTVTQGNETNYTTASQDSSNLQWSTWFLENNNSAPQAPDRRYFQYKVLMNTSNPTQLPVFKEIELDYKISSVGWKYMKSSGTTFTTTNPYEAGDLNQTNPTDYPSWSVVPKNEGNYSVRFCSNSSETVVDFNCTETRNISVFVQPSVTSFSSSLDPAGKNQTTLLTVRMLDETSSAMQGYNLSFVDERGNGSSYFIGYVVTDAQGYARINYTIPTDAELGPHTLNMTYNGSSQEFIASDSLTDQIVISSLPQITNVSVDPQTAGFGYFPFIQANVTDEKGLDKIVINITGDEGTNQYEMSHQGGGNYTYNFTNTWEVGDYSFFIIANNTDGVSSQSVSQDFYVEVDSSVNFSTQNTEYKNYEKVYLSNQQVGWEYPGWSYKRTITVSGASENLTDYQAKITLSSEELNFSRLDENGSDIRFNYYNVSSSSEQNTSYWIESWNSTSEEAVIWVKVPFIDSTEGATLYMYYGNAGASSNSNGTEVFEFFDEFSGGSLDAKWTATGAASVSNGYMRVNTGCIYTGSSQGTTPQDKVFEAKVFYHTQANSYAGLHIANDTATDGSNNPGADALAYIMTDNANNMDIWGADGTQATYNIVNDGNVYSGTQNDEDYLIGFEFRGSSQINYFMDNYSDGSQLGSNLQSGTWDDDYYLWLGYFRGASSGVLDIDDMSVDWVRVRQYTSSEPTASVGEVRLGDVGIKNTGNAAFKGYLRMLIQEVDGGSWSNILPTVVDSTLYSVPANGVLNLTQIWQSEGGWNTTNNPPGTYRVYAVMENSSNNPRRKLNDSNGNLIEGWYNFTIIEPGLQATNLTHENEQEHGINEYETGDSIDWINVTVQAINNTALDANVTLSLLDRNQDPVAWGPTETKQCGELAENETCEKQWSNSSSGYTIPTTAASGKYTFYWNITMNVSGGQTKTNKSTTFTINSIPSTFSKTTNGTTLYKPSWSYYNFTLNNTWTENLTNAIIKINCPSIPGFSCESIDSGTNTYSIGNISALTQTTIPFNVSVNESVSSDDYDVNITLNYTNPGNENRSWQQKQNQVFEVRTLGLIEIFSESYTTNLTRGQSYDFKTYANNTGDSTSNNIWLNYTLPNQWTNSSGQNKKFNSTLKNNTIIWNNITAQIGSNAQLGQQQVELSSASDSGQEDWLNLDTYVYANTSISEINTNNSWVDKGESLDLWAKLVYDNGSAVENQNISFYSETNDSLLGSDLTNSSGYAQITVEISSGTSLGSKTWNATFSNNESAFIYSSYNNTNVIVRRKPSIENVNVDPQSIGFGGTVTINASLTDDGDLSAKLLKITYPENGTQVELSMSPTGDPDTYEYAFNDTWEAGQYNFTIWVNDTYGSYNESTQYNFTVSVSAVMSVKPVNDSYNANEYVNLTSPPNYWWNASWNFRKGINVSNTAENLSNYQVKVETDLSTEYSNNKIQSYCEDARFTYYNSSSGNEILCDHWIETCNLSNSGTVTFMVEVPFIQNNTNTTIYLYYGNSGASSVSNGTSTFEFFDDFEGTSIDSSIWDASSATDSVANSSLRINAGGVGLQNPLGFNFSDGYLAETRVLFHSIENDYGTSLPELSSSQFTTGNNGNADATVLYMRTTNSRAVNYWMGDGSGVTYTIGSGITGWTSSDDTWYVTGISVDGGIVRLWRDDSNIHTESGITWSKEMDYLSLGYFDGSSNNLQDASHDWVRVRKYVETQPTLTVGTEEHTGSVISNDGSTDFSGYLIMKIQENSTGTWQDVATIIDDLGNSTIRTVNSSDLDLSLIWNPISWYTSTQDAGTYRVHSEMVGPSGNVLSSSGGYLNDSYNFEIAQPPLNLNISEIKIYDVTSSAPANRHFYTNDFIDSGLSKTFNLYKDKIYRIEVYVDNTGASTWNFNATNISYLNLSSSWTVDNENDTWYSNETDDDDARTDITFTGGTWNGNLSWNTTNLNGTASGSNDAKFFFIINFTTVEDRDVEFRIDHPSFVEKVESTFHIIEIDSNPPFLYNNQYNLTDTSINRGQSTTAYARWNETISMANVTYTTTSPVVEATQYNDSVSNPENWTNFTINSASNWFLGIHQVTIEAEDESNNWNSSLDPVNLTVWGLAQVTSSSLSVSTINVTNSTLIQCRVKDNTNSSAIPSYTVHFYNSTSELGTNTTNSSGWAVYSYTDNTPGQETLKCNITQNSTTYHQIDASNYQEETLTTQETVFPTFTTIQNPLGVKHKGENVYLNVSWHDNYDLDYAILSTNGSGWSNVSTSLTGTDDWGNFTYQIPTTMTPGTLAWKQYANDSFGNTNGSMSNQTISVWGWAEVTDGEVDPSSIQQNNYTIMNCKVSDANSSTALNGYNVSFWRGNTYLGSNSTNGSGWAEYNFTVASAGVYTIKCNITDNASSRYNASEDNQDTDSLTVTVGADTTAPFAVDGTYEINATSMYTGTCVKISAQWNETVNVSWVEFNDTASGLKQQNLTGPFTGNWTNVTLCTNSTWLLGHHVAKLYARDNSSNLNDTLAYLDFYVWGKSQVGWLIPSGNVDRGSVDLYCNVTDYESGTGINGYEVTFYDQELGSSIDTVQTNASGIATVNYDFSGTNVGPEQLTCEIDDDNNLYYNVTGSTTVQETITLYGTLNVTANPSILNRGKTENINSTITDEYGDTAKDQNGDPASLTVKWFNSTQQIGTGEDTTWNIETSTTLGAEELKINASAQYYHPGEDNASIYIYGWSNVTWIQPNGGSYEDNELLDLTCRVLDKNTTQAIDNHPVQFYENGNLLATETTNSSGYAVHQVNTNTLSNGVHTLKCNITDNSSLYYNNTQENEDSTSITVDSAAPEVSIDYPVNESNYTSSTLDLNYTITDDNPDSCWYNLDGAVSNESLPGCSNDQLTGLSDGVHNITVYANDTAGNENSSWIWFRVDANAPSITTHSPQNTTYISQQVYSNVSTDEPSSWCGYSRDSQANVTMTQENSSYYYNQSTISEGAHNITFYCNDTYGNMGSSTTTYFTVDTIEPSVTLNSPQDKLNSSNATITFNCSASDNIAIANVSLYGNWSGWSAKSTNSSGLNDTAYVFQETLPQGTFVWNCRACDNANCSSSQNRTITIDTSNPVISIVTPENSSYNTTTLDLNYTVSDDNTHSCWYDLNGTGNNTLADCNNITLPALGENTHNVTVYANDTAGNEGQANVSFTIDLTNPGISISSPENITYNSTNAVDLNYSVSDNVQVDICWYSKDGESIVYKTSCQNTTLTGLSNDAHNVTVYVNDTAGNANSSTIYFTVNVTDLVVTPEQPENKSYNRNWVWGNVTLNKVSSSCNYSLDSQANQTMSNTTDTDWYSNVSSITEGAHNITFYCNDVLTGNVSQSSYVYFRVDLTNPDLTIQSPENTTYNTSSVALNYSSSDDVDVDQCYYSLDGQADQSLPACSNDTLVLSDGAHNVTVYVNDTAGNANSSTVHFTVDTGLPSVSLNLPSDGNSTSSTSIDFNCTASDNIDLANVTLYGNWSGWHANETNSSGINNTNYVFTKTLTHGSYEWNCRACDSINNCVFAVSNYTLTIDTQGPVITWEDPTPDDGDYVGNNWTYVNVSTDETAVALLEWTNGTGSYNFTMNGANTSFWYNMTGLSDTNYSFRVLANDSFDQWTNTSTIGITVSTTAPIITIHSPTEQTYSSNLVYLNVTANKQIDTWMYNLAGVNRTFTDNFTLAAFPGSNTLYVYGNDSTGNTGSDTVNFTIDAAFWEDNFSWDSGVNGSTKASFEGNATIKPCWTLFDSEGCWPYKKQVNISGSSSILSNHPVRLNINLTQEYNQGKVNASCKDLRFSWLNSTEQTIDYWIDSCNASGGNVSAWVEVPSIATTGETLYVYYGNMDASDQGNASQVFALFDDFDTVSSDWGDKYTNWQSTDSIATPTVSGSNSKLEHTYTFPDSYATELRWRGSSTGGYYRFGDGSGQYNLRFYVDPDDGRVNLYNGSSNFYSINSTEQHTYSIISDFDNDEYKVYIDHNTEAISITGPSAGSNQNPVFYAQAANGMYIDWIAVRAYESPEPNISSVSSEQTSPNNGSLHANTITPNPFYAWDTFYAETSLPAGTNMTFKIMNSTNASLCGDITSSQASTGYSVCSGANNYGSVHLYADLTTNDSSATPVLIDWNISWTEQQQELIKILDSSDNEYVINTTILSNDTGILDLNIIIQNTTEIHEINVHDYTQGSPNNEIKIDSLVDTGFEKNYSIDLSSMNCTNANFTVTAVGDYLLKCTDFDSSSQQCNSREAYETFLTNLSSGANYTFTLNATDPGFGETLQGASDTTDAFIYGKASKQDSNYGANTIISVGSDASSEDQRGVISFDLTDLPSSSTVNSAILRLYFSEIPSGDTNDNRTHGIHRIQLSPARDWQELEATWNDYSSSNSWSSSGGDFNATATDTIEVGSTLEDSWIEFNVTYDVQTFVDEDSNYGWVIKDNDESGSKTRRYYYSSNYNDNTSRRPQLVVNYTLPDLTVSNVSFSNDSPVETDVINVTAEITNLENAAAENVTIDLNISQWNGSAWNWKSNQQTQANISASGTALINFSWTAEPGTYLFNVTVDPQNNTVETNYSNNNNHTNLTVDSWSFYHGQATGAIVISDTGGSNFTTWMPTEMDGNIYVTDKDATILFSSLKPLNGTNDFVEADEALNMSGFDDSVSALFDADGNGGADSNSTFVVWGRTMTNVPTVNSINNSNFITGVLWDSGDGGLEYNGTQDLVFITEIEDDLVGAYGTYDYELRSPANLRQWKSGSDLLEVYIELR